MNITNISRIQTTISRASIEEALRIGSSGLHESLCRSYHIVEKVKELLQIGTPPTVVLEMIELMEPERHGPTVLLESDMV